ncbi:FdhF/YdeP family oxidoreductase [candidate division KSB1 bacterium]|nr:FdhF/YdeP family oxidoreductase [candidate division KSB1 bacterium]
MKLWSPSTWISFIPNGLGHVKPNHYWDMLKAALKNRDELRYAWRILNDGVCDGCALGTTGMRDFTMEGVHLCMVRLNLMRLNTAPALDMRVLENVQPLLAKNAAELRELGRLPYPMIRRAGAAGFRRINWKEAFSHMAAKIRATDPQRLAFYLTSRGLTNEVYYVAQKVARFLGTNNIDNSARICHAPSTVALKQMLGVSASTCSYSDWIGTDVLVFIGSDAPNNQPVTTKYMYYAKQQGTKIIVINPYREPGLARYWVPSVFESALFGTKLADRFFQVHVGGDLAFINGVIKHLIEKDWIDARFIQQHANGFEELRIALAQQSWEMLERASGASTVEMYAFAEMLAHAKSAVFVWSMGITQHRNGVENVKAIINLALARGFVGKEKCGLMAIRGHSGVQGGAEVGAVPNQFPGGVPVSMESAKQLEALWGFPVPTTKGYSAVEMIDAAHENMLDMFYIAGGNFLETLPEPEYVREALLNVPLRVHQDLVLTPQMLLAPKETVLLLPACTRYEQKGGGTETSTERRIYFSPEIPGRRIGEARSEWEIFMELAEQVYPERREQIHFESAQRIREEIAQAVPYYDGIQNLKAKGDAMQWGGSRLCEGQVFGTQDRRAHFAVLQPAFHSAENGKFVLTTRRGKQFNSMVQAEIDPLNGASRTDVLMSNEDAIRMELREGQLILLKNEIGEYRGRVKLAEIKAGNLQVHWPEGNVLIARGVTDPLCGIPDYNTVVEVRPLMVG